MNLDEILRERSGNTCELCASEHELHVFTVLPPSRGMDSSTLLCRTCIEQIEDPLKVDPNHWRCLNTSMWSTFPAVQVLVWRMLNQLRQEGWPQDLLDMLYLDDETLAWAKDVVSDEDVTGEKILHKDSNGTLLQSGDTVVLIKDLDVRGGGFTAKRGTAVRGITLVEDNAGQIEGKVNGQQIVILTQYVKKSG
jgi:protein PhnA